jgi:hypothetical protein
MKTVNRRRFLQVGTAGAAALGWTAPLASAQSADRIGSSPDDWVVRLSGDGLGLTSPQYSRLLVQLAEERGIQIDNYSVGGVIDQLEKEFARVLGKERAVFMPTGTLANNIAVRALAGGPSRVIVQEESHLYQDEGDCAQTLSNLTLIPLAAGPIPRGTNLFRLKVRTPDAVLFQKRLATRGVILAPPQADTFVVAVNETIARMPAAELADRLASAVAG